MKYIYLIRRGDLNTSTNMFSFYNFEAFSSKSKALHSVKNTLEINNAFSIEVEGENAIWISSTDFSTLSTDGRLMRVRLLVERHELR